MKWPTKAEYLRDCGRTSANTGSFYGLILILVGVFTFNIWIFLFGAFLILCSRITERRQRQWEDEQRRSGNL